MSVFYVVNHNHEHRFDCCEKAVADAYRQMADKAFRRPWEPSISTITKCVKLNEPVTEVVMGVELSGDFDELAEFTVKGPRQIVMENMPDSVMDVELP
jgi:hypothetical protein